MSVLPSLVYLDVSDNLIKDIIKPLCSEDGGFKNLKVVLISLNLYKLFLFISTSKIHHINISIYQIRYL